MLIVIPILDLFCICWDNYEANPVRGISKNRLGKYVFLATYK